MSEDAVDPHADDALSADLWDEVIGQDAAVEQLRSAARNPVHAYLIVGPEGSGKRAAARAFAAELLTDGLSPSDADLVRRQVAAEHHPAMVVVERDGASIAVGQAEAVVREAAMSSTGGGRRVFVLVDFHLVDKAGPTLLKVIEEPNPGTFFVVLAETVPPELVTIASRCVRVDLDAVPTGALVARLVAEGVDSERAELLAAGAGGSLSRARLLARDPEFFARRDAWFSAPTRLDGTGAAACVVADELLGQIDGVLEPLAAQHAEELADLLAGYEAVGLEAPRGEIKKVEDRQKRQQRRVRTDELRAGLAVLISAYRDRLVGGGSSEDFLRAADAVQSLCDGLAFNPNERLQLRALFVGLPALPR